MLKDFRAFILRGNVLDLAVAVVIGAAFTAVVTSLVEDLITPFLAIPGTVDFSELKFTISDSEFTYGNFLNALFAFLTIAGAVFFFVVRPVNKLMARRKTEPDVESTTRECPECLSSIPRAARRCAFCTAEVPPAPVRAEPAPIVDVPPAGSDEEGTDDAVPAEPDRDE